MSSQNDLLSWQIRQPTSRRLLMANTEDAHAANDQRATTAALPRSINTSNGRFGIQLSRLDSGKSAGMDCLTIDTGAVVAAILPDRGMGLWKCWAKELELGWHSPVVGPVNPAFVPIDDSTGIGWLEGFDELLVRCGLNSNGAPEFNQNGTVRYPLHGRIANLPAHQLDVQIDIENGILDVIGVVCETRFLIYNLELETRYRFRAGSPVIEVVDIVTNQSTKQSSMQLLYHINIGAPIVHGGATIHTPIQELVPRDARAKEGLENWNVCEAPQAGFQEQVYLITPKSDEDGWSEALLAAADESFGLSVRFDTQTLPFLNVWKNTAAIEDGYVVGLEPATGFPNPKSVEEQAGRVMSLEGGQSKVFRLEIRPLTHSAEVAESRKRIAVTNRS